MSESSKLPASFHVQRGEDAPRHNFSPTSVFRVVAAGGPGLPDFYEDRSARGDGPPLHRHPWPSWELILDGQIRAVIGDETVTLHSGDALYVPPGVPHAYVIESESAHIIGVNLSDGRFPRLQESAAEIMLAPGGPDMKKVATLAEANGVEILGPPLSVE